MQNLARVFASNAAGVKVTNQPGSLLKISHGSLHVSKPTWWLESRFHFSFADHYDPSKTNLGALRVLNDDLVKGHAGFGTHGHRDAEIFSYILEGRLTHQDSLGNKEALPRGCVQYLSAGTGVRHSEVNDGQETTRFLQVWITPDRSGHKPQYGSAKYNKADRHNQLLLILGGTGTAPAWSAVAQRGAPAHLHQDVNVFVSEMDAGTRHAVTLGAGRQAYLVAMEGSLTVNGDESLGARDAMAVVADGGGAGLPLGLAAGPDGAHIMLIEMQAA